MSAENEVVWGSYVPFVPIVSEKAGNSFKVFFRAELAEMGCLPKYFNLMEYKRARSGEKLVYEDSGQKIEIEDSNEKIVFKYTEEETEGHASLSLEGYKLDGSFHFIYAYEEKKAIMRFSGMDIQFLGNAEREDYDKLLTLINPDFDPIENTLLSVGRIDLINIVLGMIEKEGPVMMDQLSLAEKQVILGVNGTGIIGRELKKRTDLLKQMSLNGNRLFPKTRDYTDFYHEEKKLHYGARGEAFPVEALIGSINSCGILAIASTETSHLLVYLTFPDARSVELGYSENGEILNSSANKNAFKEALFLLECKPKDLRNFFNFVKFVLDASE